MDVSLYVQSSCLKNEIINAKKGIEFIISIVRFFSLLYSHKDTPRITNKTNNMSKSIIIRMVLIVQQAGHLPT